jgi:dCTP deaminase
MTVASDLWIAKMVRERGIIEPFSPAQVTSGITYGLSAYGYDARLADEFLAPVPGQGALDPKEVTEADFQAQRRRAYTLPPGAFVLGRTLEYVRMPREALGLCYGKSTYARCGLVVNVTPLEPEWEGYVTLCLVNGGPRSLTLHAEEGITQIIFLLGDQPCSVSYGDRKGRYQAQRGVTVARATPTESQSPARE